MFRRIGEGLVAAGGVLAVALRDLAGLAAVASIVYGSWMLHPAAGFIVGGVLVLAGVILMSMKRRQG